MKIPTATYRLQFRNGMDFDRAVEIVPYLRDLGISHLYASPLFAATPGSTHGYDVVDHNRIDPQLGGMEGFERLAAALHSSDIGLILDIVPNHMGAHLANGWWASVLEWGVDSPFARHFDIDWSERLTLPILGKSFETCVSDGEVFLDVDETLGVLGLRYFDNVTPLHPRAYASVFDRLPSGSAAVLPVLAAAATPQSSEQLHGHLRELPTATLSTLRLQLRELSDDHQYLGVVHAAQPWRLTFWRSARQHLSYRRFFEVTGLVGVRVEDAAVFEDVHRLTFELVRAGHVQGLRIDHVDGLADPAQYLERLRDQVGDDMLIFVEKILEENETVPDHWPIEGTTGYEFIADVSKILVDESKSAELDAAYATAVGNQPDLESEGRAIKATILRHNLAAELARLVDRASRIAALEAVQLGQERVEAAIVAILSSFPVYRLYGAESKLSADDEARLAATLNAVGRNDATDFVGRVLRLEVGHTVLDEARDFRTRFQQTSGPVMAKAIEDTLFYRRNRLLALNEVGVAPGVVASGIDDFHRSMMDRLKEPNALTATATHDTKRGEDSRTRLYALSEAPQEWAAAVQRWRHAHHRLVRDLPGGAAPEPEVEWLMYQALAGVWPMTFEGGDETALSTLRSRFSGYIRKAMREAKVRTDWTDVDEAYESAVDDYASALLAPEAEIFRRDFDETLQPFLRTGALNSLTQLALKLTVPGVPDVYQGTEIWDLSLVDPDNRRAVDFSALRSGLGEARRFGVRWCLEHWREGSAKHLLLAAGLGLRRSTPHIFSHGDYQPLAVSGVRDGHLIAFERRLGNDTVAIVAPRLTFGLLDGGTGLHIPGGAWHGTVVDLPPGLVNAITDEELPTGRLAVGQLLDDFPVALLTNAR